MNSLNEYIRMFSKCSGKKEGVYSCDRYNHEHFPLFMYPCSNSSVMIISESPSQIASSNRALNNKNNLTFYNDIIRILFNNPYISNSVLEKEFNEQFYWTHFCKCFPGPSTEKGSLNSICARNYLKREIEIVDPKFIVTFGGPAAKFLFNVGRRKSMSPLVNRVNQYELENKRNVNVVCITHFSGINTRKKKLFHEETCKLVREELVRLGVRYVKP